MEAQVRDWRVLSEAASREQDPEKLIALVEELNRALPGSELVVWADAGHEVCGVGSRPNTRPHRAVECLRSCAYR